MFAPASRPALYLLVMQQTGGCIGETIAYEFPTAGNQIQAGNAVELQLLWRTSWGPPSVTASEGTKFSIRRPARTADWRRTIRRDRWIAGII